MDINKYLATDRKWGQVRSIKCKDGFRISVQASRTHYCTPKNNEGPWTHVECAYPSEVPHLIMEYCEHEDSPTDSIYGFVPVELVEQLIEEHGGLE